MLRKLRKPHAAPQAQRPEFFRDRIGPDRLIDHGVIGGFRSRFLLLQRVWLPFAHGNTTVLYLLLYSQSKHFAALSSTDPMKMTLSGERIGRLLEGQYVSPVELGIAYSQT